MFSSGAAGTPSAARTTRRTTRAARAASALASGASTPASPPAAQTQRTLGANLAIASKALSASPAPSRRTRSVAAVSDAGSALMDVEDGAQAQGKDSDRLLVKDESYAITERKSLPVEVQQAISASDPYTLPVKAILDPITGFALLVGSEHCFVWNWASHAGSTTTYVFPLPPQAPFPPGVTAYSPLSFASLVPSPSQTTQREPGLLAVSNTGTVRFWESISLSLAGADRFKSLSLALAEGELVRDLVLLSPTTYLASTSQSRIFALTVVSHGGRATLSSRTLERAVGWAGSVWSAVFGSKAVDPRAGILALAVSPPAGGMGEGERTVYAVQEKSAQVWKVPARAEGGERLVAEQDVFHAVLEALAGEKVGNEQWAMNEGRVEIVDAAVTAAGHLALLVSHVHGATAHEYRSFAIVQLDVAHDAVTPVGLTLLAFQNRPDPRPLSTPQLSIGTGEVAFVVFADAVVIASIAPDSAFEEAFPLRQNATRFLGLSKPAYLPVPPSSTETLALLTSAPSLVTVSVSAPQGTQRLAPGAGGADALKTRRLQTRLEQAIFYGTREAENPLAFDIQPDFEGDLAKAAAAVSAEILASSSSHMPLILDLRAQLADRTHRSKALIEYINANGLMTKLPQAARKQLSWDAERLQAAVALWAHVNARIGASGQSILADAIHTFMDEVGEGFGDDPLRLFFRTKVAAVGNVLEEVAKQARAVVDSPVDAEEKSEKLHEANQVLLLAFKAVARHRTATATYYGLSSPAEPLEPWSSRPVLLEALQWHFDATDALLRERVRELGAQQRGGAGAAQDELKNQMAGVAEHAFSAFEERLRFLQTVNGDAATPESRHVTDRYHALRPRFIRTLVAVGKVGAAFELGERHGDFESLVRLSNDPSHGSAARIATYLDRHGKEFAFPLYRFYLDHGMLRTLLEPEEAHRPLLTSFLDSTDNDKLAWINDIAIGRLDHATDVLFTVAEKEQDVVQKKIMLSLSKLAQVAQVNTQTLEDACVQQTLETLDDNLDLVNTQEGLKTLFESLLSGSEARLAPVEQGEVMAARIAPALEDRPALAQHLAKLAGRLFQGQTLTAEDLIDLLSLKENVGEQANDFAAALDVLVRAKDLPAERRQVALESIWRRVYIQDDWASLRSAVNVSDEEMASALRNTAYYTTLAAAAQSSHSPSDLLSPAQAFSTATTTSLSARWPDFPSPSIALLLNDIEQENRLLSECVQSGLEAFGKEIARLLEEGGAEDEELGGEVVMVE